MPTMNLEDVQSHLQEVIDGLNPGEPLVITRQGEPVATLTRSELKTWSCKAGSDQTDGYSMALDFDAPIDEFREFMD